ncbi:uncharacterized protein [Hetaerina americana]|uniref:uncharacterized protein isoform X2 n=1 Tax=Hetaerina americana TaxID=62018 RepID=UPI003A7F1CB6
MMVRELLVLLLATISSVHLREIASASYGDEPSAIAGHRGGWGVGDGPSSAGPRITSPCPDVLLSIKDNRKTSRWYGVISLTPDEAIDGIDLSIRLDKRALLLGTWLGEVFTDDKIYFTISDDKMKILPGENFAVRFFIKYNETDEEPPNVKTISLNGKQICPAIKATPAIPTTLPPRHSRGSSTQYQANQVQLDSSKVASLLIGLLRRLARVQSAPSDAPLAIGEVHEDSFGKRGGHPRASRVENLDGLLDTVFGLLTTDEEAASGPGVPDVLHDGEAVDDDRGVQIHSTSNPTGPSPLPNSPERTTSAPDTMHVKTNGGISERRGMVKGRAFVLQVPENQNYYETEDYYDIVPARLAPDPTKDPQLDPETKEETTSEPTTPPAEDTPAPSDSEFVAVKGDSGTEDYDTQDYYGTEVVDETTSAFSSNVTDSYLFPETQDPTTSAPTTINVGISPISNERVAVEREEGDRGIPLEGTEVPLGGDEVLLGGVNVPLGGVTVPLGGTKVRLGGDEVPLGGSKVRLGGDEVPLGGAKVRLGGVNVPLGGAEIRLGGDKVPLGGDKVPPGGDKVPPGGDKVPPGGDEVPLGGAKVPLGGAKVRLGGVNVPLGGAEIRLGGDKVPLGGDKVPPGGDKVPPGGDEVPLGGGEVRLGGDEVPARSAEVARGGAEILLEGPESGGPPLSASPCPGVFSYFNRLSGNDVWYGNITLTTDEDLVGLRVDIELDKRAQGLGALFGMVSTKNNMNYTIWNSKATIDPGESVYVYFFVKYGAEGMAPRIKTIRLNGIQICSAKKEETTAPVTTLLPGNGEDHRLLNHEITLETTTVGGYQQTDSTTNPPEYLSQRKNSAEQVGELMEHLIRLSTPEKAAIEQVAASVPVTPSVSTSSDTVGINLPSYDDEINYETTVKIAPPADLPSSYEDGNKNYEETSDFMQRQQDPVDVPPISATEEGISEEDACGRNEVAPSQSANFERGAMKERWPWQAAIYEIRDDNLYYICGGSLVGKRTILTAARCLSDGQNEDLYNPKSLAVYLGKHSLLRWDAEVQYREVKEIHIHPQFDSKNINDDIAVVIISNPVELSPYVQPICLGEETKLSGVRQEGVVVGWGFDRHGNVSDELTISRMPLLSLRTCSSRYPDLDRRLSDKIYCAGYRSRTTVCSGESGDGMFFSSPDHRRPARKWSIRGVASFTLSRKSTTGCSASNYVVFTDVAKYLNWIRKYR